MKANKTLKFFLACCTCAGFVYCQHQTLLAPGDGHLSIMTQKTKYRWHTDDLGNSKLIQATLTNTSKTTYYADLGDGLDSSLDQEYLLLAQGTGGSIERQNEDGSWSAMPLGVLFEGSRFIALRPQQSYRLTGYLFGWQGNETGHFRVKVMYFDRLDPAADAQPLLDYSNVFTISR